MENEFENELKHHPEFSPSRLPAWTVCPHFEGGGETADTRLGTELHRQLSMHLCGMANETLDNGLQDFIVDRAARTIQKLLEEFFGTEDWSAESEMKLELSAAYTDAIVGRHVDIPIFGTADVAAYTHHEAKLFIADFKSFYSNRDYTPQLAFYALALAEKFGCVDDTPVRLVVVCGDREGFTTIDTTIGCCYNLVKYAIDNRENRDAKPPKTSFWCSLCAKCGSCAYAQDALAIEPFSPAEVTVAPERLPFLLLLATEIEKRISALREYAKKAAKENGGYLVDTQGKACYTLRTQTKSTIDCWKLFELTRDKVGEENFMLALSINKTKAEQLLKASGMKAKEAKELIAEASTDPVEYEVLARVKDKKED